MCVKKKQEVRSYLSDLVGFVNSRGSGIPLPLDQVMIFLAP